MESKEKIKLLLSDYSFEIIDQARNGITISDPNQVDNPLLYVNKAFIEKFEYSFDEVVGRNCRFLQKDDREQKNLEIIRDAVKNEKEGITVLRNYTKSGKLIYNEVRVSPIFDKKTGKLKFFLGVQKDMTNTAYREYSEAVFNDEITSEIINKFNLTNKTDTDTLLQELNIYQTELLAQNEELIQKDKKLQVANEEFSSLFLHAPIPYMLIDNKLEIKRFNYLSNECFDFNSSKIQIKSLFFYTKKENIQKLISWISNKDYEKFSLEIDMISKNNMLRRYKLNAKEYFLDDNLLMISLVDIQEEFEIKNDLEKKVQEEVEKRIKQDKFIEKQAKLASMGEMIDIIAHQWLNPLTLIGLYSQNSALTISEIEKRSEELAEIEKDLEGIDSQVIHLVSTLNEFRSFFRADKESSYTSTKVLIDSVLLLLKDELIKNKIVVRVDYQRDLKIKVIDNQFKHVLINLINNSRDAFIEKGIKDRKIIFEINAKENTLYYYDNAGGIPEDSLAEIFEFNYTTKGNSGGTGIGLYLCKQVIKKFNCQIEVKNVEKGVCFKICFSK